MYFTILLYAAFILDSDILLYNLVLFSKSLIAFPCAIFAVVSADFFESGNVFGSIPNMAQLNFKPTKN
jgi:hypothetical protein